MTDRIWLRGPIAVLFAGAMAACTGGDSGTRALDSCIFVAHYQGHTYEGVGVRVAPVEGELLGTAVLPSCDHIGGQDSPPPDEVIQVAALSGVSPDVALVWHDVTDRILVREGTGPLPPELQELLETPSCDSRDAPIEMDGPWLGIVDGDQTEVDLLPPYQVDMQVARSSAQRYRRAFLTIQVPQSLGRPLSREDVETSLWKGGSISVTASCQDGGFVAEELTAFPPT